VSFGLHHPEKKDSDKEDIPLLIPLRRRMGLSSGALPIRDIIIRELSSQVLVSQAPHNHAPTHWALTRRDGVPEESIVKSSGCVPATPTTPTSKNVVGKVLASKPSVSDVIVLPVLPQRIVLSTSPPDQSCYNPILTHFLFNLILKGLKFEIKR